MADPLPVLSPVCAPPLVHRALASGSPGDHNRLRAAQSSVRLYRVMKSHQSLVRKSRARHGIVLPYGGWRMPAPASRRARGRLTSTVTDPCFHRTGTRTSLKLSSTFQSSRHIRTRYLRWLRSKVQVSTFYSSTRVSQRPPVAVHVHVIAELLARACHVTCARTPSHTAIPSTAPRRPCLSYIPRLRSLWL